MTKFWIVWSPTGNRPPSHRHSSAESAVAEAIRLAEHVPGAEFFVLEALGSAKKVVVQWTDAVVDGGDIPF